MDVIINL